MTPQSLQPVLPDYLTQAVTEATEALEEVRNIIAASNELEENLEQVSQAVADAEAELGDQEAEARLRRQPDITRINKLQKKLDGLRAEQSKLIATGKALEQRRQRQDELVIEACSNLNSARRKFGRSMLLSLNAALDDAVQPLQDVLDIVGSINHFVDFAEYSYPRQDALIRGFGGNRHLIRNGINYTPQGLPRELSSMARQWVELLTTAEKTLLEIQPVTDHCRRAIEARAEKAAEERMRQERLQPRVI